MKRFAAIFILLYVGLIRLFERTDSDRAVKEIVRRIKANGGGGLEFDCEGYIVRIYEPDTNMNGPWKA